MHVIYNLAISLYRLLVILLSPFNKKADLWYRGRKGFFNKWKYFNKEGRRLIWFHCASLGEFEQGRPVIEEIRKRDRNVLVLLTFFSPSGMEVRKDYPLADVVCYLPADTPANARKFLNIFNPDMAVFVKYEFWYNYLDLLGKRSIPFYLISASFRADQIFFRWYGKWFAGLLHKFTHIFVQSDVSLHLLKSAGVYNVTVAGDTRFDRVYEIAQGSGENQIAKTFSSGKYTMVAGSTWPADHDVLVKFVNYTRHNIKLIIAPHEIHEKEIEALALRFNKRVIRYSQSAASDLSLAEILIVDNIGILSSIYQYGELAYIGGGFGKNIHNILEACTHGVPVMFGPKYKNFLEARELVDVGGAFPVNSYDSLVKNAEALIEDKVLLRNAGLIAENYVKARIGATRLIVDKILIS